MSSNQAAWLPAKGNVLKIGPAEIPNPGPDEVVIRTRAVAINPIDYKIQDAGFFIQKWPAILGEDVAGEIYKVGASVTRFKEGDRVASHSIMFIKQEPAYGGFQEYVLAAAAWTALLPKSISYSQGAVFPLAIDAAAAGLYAPTSEGGLGLAYPSMKPSPSGKIIVVWGGASSVGSQAIQLAVASGVRVITVAASRNFAHCKSLGASKVFDYKEPSVIEDILRVLSSSSEEFAGVYDAISLPESYKHVMPILEKAGGKNLAVVTPGEVENVPAGVKVGTVFAVNPIVHPVWSDFFTEALEAGKLKPAPEVFIVGKGLESVQKGLDLMRDGVSAKKLVIEM